MNQQEYDQAQTWMGQAPSPVPTLAEYISLSDAIKNLAPWKRPTIHRYPINITNLVMLDAQYFTDRYERFQHHWCVTTATAVTYFRKTNLGAGGLLTAFNYPAYRLMVSPINADGSIAPAVERARSSINAGSVKGTFNITFGPEDGCPVMGIIEPLDATGQPVVVPTESFPPFLFWLDRNGTAKNFPLVIAQNGTFDWTHPGPPPLPYNVQMATPAELKWIAFPKAWTLDRPSYPLVPRVPIQATVGVTKPIDLSRVNLVPTVDTMGMNLFEPRITNRGITVCEGIQGYFWGELVRPAPHNFQSTDLLDGPRGTPLAYMLHGWPSRRPGSTIARKVYGGDNNRIFKIGIDGTITTLLGLRNKGNIPRYQTDFSSPYNEKRVLADFDIVGNWDPSIPVTEQFPWESWFSLFNPVTTITDALALPVTDNVTPPPGEQPHLAPGPQMIVGDTRHNCILSAQFNFKDHAVPPQVKRIASALDPWGGDLYDPTSFVFAERGANRLQVMGFDGTRKSVLLEDTNGSKWGKVNEEARTFQYDPSIYNYTDFNNGKLAYLVRQGSQCVAPEGVAVMDDWVYFGSFAMGGVFRKNKVTGQYQLCALPFISSVQSHFIQIAVADGTIPGIPRHSIMTNTFAINEFGLPALWLEVAGTSTFGEPLTHSKKAALLSSYGYETTQGPHHVGGIYPTAVGTNGGMIVFGGTQFGVGVLVQRDPTVDLPAPDGIRMMVGGQKWRVNGYDLIWGRFGYGFHKMPLPWGEDADIDYWLTNNGHTKA